MYFHLDHFARKSCKLRKKIIVAQKMSLRNFASIELKIQFVQHKRNEMVHKYTCNIDFLS